LRSRPSPLDSHVTTSGGDLINTRHASLARDLSRDETGQDLIEYSLLLAFIALAAMALLLSAGGGIKTLWTHINSSLTSAAS